MRFIAILAAAFVLVSCDPAPVGTSEETPPTGPPPGGTLGCRTLATAWSAAYGSEPPTATSATFDATARVYTERTPPTSESDSRRVTYWSQSDFIDEAAVMARFVYRRADYCPDDECIAGRSIAEIPTYDAQRRMKSFTLQVNGFPLFIETFTAWDAVGRPTAGFRDLGFCSEPLTIKYDAAARTFEKGGSGTGTCAASSGYQKTTFDANGNIVSENVATGGAGSTRTRTITATALSCKPD